MNSACPCGSARNYDLCCAPIIKGQKPAPTAEALMRSRYTAYVKNEIDHVERTHDSKARAEFDRAAAKAWSENTEWKGLEIKATEAGGPDDAEGTVEFVARYKTVVPGMEAQDVTHHEVSLFKREEGAWVYVDGKIIRSPVTRGAPKIGRNDPCACGSGKKYKKCCGSN